MEQMSWQKSARRRNKNLMKFLNMLLSPQWKMWVIVQQERNICSSDVNGSKSNEQRYGAS